MWVSSYTLLMNRADILTLRIGIVPAANNQQSESQFSFLIVNNPRVHTDVEVKVLRMKYPVISSLPGMLTCSPALLHGVAWSSPSNFIYNRLPVPGREELVLCLFCAVGARAWDTGGPVCFVHVQSPGADGERIPTRHDCVFYAPLHAQCGWATSAA